MTKKQNYFNRKEENIQKIEKYSNNLVIFLTNIADKKTNQKMNKFCFYF